MSNSGALVVAVPVGVSLGASVGVEDSVGAGAWVVVVAAGVGVPVVVVSADAGAFVALGVDVVPELHVTEFPSAERTHVICDPVLPGGVVADVVGTDEPVPPVTPGWPVAGPCEEGVPGDVPAIGDAPVVSCLPEPA
ncbi:MAG: hypothetical protein ABIZ07_06600 [Dermatophilaceae bacterium]